MKTYVFKHRPEHDQSFQWKIRPSVLQSSILFEVSLLSKTTQTRVTLDVSQHQLVQFTSIYPMYPMHVMHPMYPHESPCISYIPCIPCILCISYILCISCIPRIPRIASIYPIQPAYPMYPVYLVCPVSMCTSPLEYTSQILTFHLRESSRIESNQMDSARIESEDKQAPKMKNNQAGPYTLLDEQYSVFLRVSYVFRRFSA